MNDSETLPDLTMENRLKAIAYQFIALYERWSEDRQLAVKQGADTAELVKLFTEQVKSFKELEPNVRKSLAASIQRETDSAAEKIGKTLSEAATRSTEAVAYELATVTEKTKRTLMAYESEVVATQWKVIGISFFTTIVTSLLLVWWLIPRPTLPLDHQQLKQLEVGMMTELVWPKLSKQEKNHWLKLMGQEIKNQHDESRDHEAAN